MGPVRNAYKISVIRLEGKRPFRRPRHIWKEQRENRKEKLFTQKSIH
jgi:hypothetical protein